MGANLTEDALQRAAPSVSTLHAMCKKIDNESNVPTTTSSHTTKSETNDSGRVITAVLYWIYLQVENTATSVG